MRRNRTRFFRRRPWGWGVLKAGRRASSIFSRCGTILGRFVGDLGSAGPRVSCHLIRSATFSISGPVCKEGRKLWKEATALVDSVSLQGKQQAARAALIDDCGISQVARCIRGSKCFSFFGPRHEMSKLGSAAERLDQKASPLRVLRMYPFIYVLVPVRSTSVSNKSASLMGIAGIATMLHLQACQKQSGSIGGRLPGLDTSRCG